MVSVYIMLHAKDECKESQTKDLYPEVTLTDKVHDSINFLLYISDTRSH